VLTILNDYGSLKFIRTFINTPLGLHRLIEALKHMLAYRMNLGDPKFVNIKKYQDNMLSTSFAAEFRQKIKHDTTLPFKDYLPKWNQLNDHGTSHFCVVDKDRNVKPTGAMVSMTATINHYFGAGVLSPSTGIILNNQMDDFSAPTEKSDKDDELPPAPSNFIEPNKRPLPSMSPLIILNKKNLENFEFQQKQPRVYHKLEPNVVLYENWTVVTGEHIELSLENRSSLKKRNHKLNETAAGAICQLVVQKDGKLTAVSDPRKGGMPAGIEEKVNPKNRKINTGFHN
ncbi:hypothetical protein MKX03_022974, partial [Papaver bracteatum]